MKSQEQNMHSKNKVSRRGFIGKTAVAVSVCTIVLSCVLDGSGRTAPSDKLNIARIGIGDNGRSEVTRASTGGNILWYRQPAEEWVEALPVGNGRLGGMVFGSVQTEHIQMNEDTLWSGGKVDRNNPKALENLPEVRRLLSSGKPREAMDLANSTMTGIPKPLQSYQPLGDLYLQFQGHDTFTDYRRELDLDRALVRVRYQVDDATFVREVFSTAVDQVIVVRLSCDKPGRISFDASLSSPQPGTETRSAGNETLRIFGQQGPRESLQEENAPWEGKGMKFEGRLHAILDGGSASPVENQLQVRDANAVTLLFAAATSFKNSDDISGDPEVLSRTYIDKAVLKPFQQLRDDHITDYQRLFHRVAINVGAAAAGNRPTDQRLENVQQENDPQLMALLFQFGRYLLISSSRPGTQPANLQGIWNDQLYPEWGCKWTLNINAEMNYWPAEITNLAECHGPLFDLIDVIRESGRRTAKIMYGCRGFVVHHNTDIWGSTAPVDSAQFGMWPMGGAWLSLHLWEHYAYGKNTDFLARRAYPVMKEAAEFFLDYLVDHTDGYWVTGPSLSPETGYRMPNGESGKLCMGPSMDIQIVRELFSRCIEASEILGENRAFRDRLGSVLERLPGHRYGKHGELREWLEDYESSDQNHLHISHLFAVFPGSQITVDTTPALAGAARVSLERRGDAAGMAWGMAWRAACWARLQDGNRAQTILKNMLATNTNPSFLTEHGLFQIDGNLSATAAIAEMLLQSHNGIIRLLPALPEAWPAGYVKGLRARGGFEIDIAWKDGELTEATIISRAGEMCTVQPVTAVDVKSDGQIIRVRKPDEATIAFETNASKTYVLAAKK